MALSEPSLKGLLQGSLAGVGDLGEKSEKMATVVARSYNKFLTQIIKVSTLDIGSAGPVGQGVGPVIAVPAAFAAACAIQAPVAGALGPYGAVTLSAIGLACGTYALTGQASTNHVGVAVGVGSGVIVGAVPPVLLCELMNQAVAQQMQGPNIVPMMTAIANGLATATQSIVVVSTIVGAPVVPNAPGVGSGQGALV